MKKIVVNYDEGTGELKNTKDGQLLTVFHNLNYQEVQESGDSLIDKMTQLACIGFDKTEIAELVKLGKLK